MRSVHFVGTEHSSRRDHADREFSLLHDAGLDRRRLGTQHDLLIDIERILLILCRMVRRDVQFLEVVLIILDLRSFNNLISHANEDALYFFLRDRIRMSVADDIFLGRERHVDNFLFHLLLADGLLHLYLCLIQQLLDGRSCVVDQLSHLRSFLRRNIFHPLEHCSELTFSSEELHTHVVEFLRQVGSLDLRDRLRFDLFQFFFHHLLLSAVCRAAHGIMVYPCGISRIIFP